MDGEVRQKILIMLTDGSDPRSAADGWTMECGFTAERDLMQAQARQKFKESPTPVGLIGHAKEFYLFATPLHAMAAGWRVMHRPKKHKANSKTGEDQWEWWLEK
jgi:hypothetical protein